MAKRVQAGQNGSVSPLEVAILGWSARAFSHSELQRLRGELRLPNGQAIPHAFVRHAEDQTLAALAAVLQTMAELPQHSPQCHQWGVLAAPEYFGREATLASLRRYSQEGAAAISPHLIPNHCLHSLAGSLSVLLGCHGPNYGIGGAPGQFVELLLAGICETLQGLAPGYWLVATGWRQAPYEFGYCLAKENVCLALALAVSQPTASVHSYRATLRWQPWPSLFSSEYTTCSSLSLDSFIRALYQANGETLDRQGTVIRWPIAEVGVLELHRSAVGAVQEAGASQREAAA